MDANLSTDFQVYPQADPDVKTQFDFILNREAA